MIKTHSYSQISYPQMKWIYRNVDRSQKEVILITQVGGSGNNHKIKSDALNYIFNVINQYQDHICIFLYDSQQWENEYGFIMEDGQLHKIEINDFLQQLDQNYLLKFYVDKIEAIENKLQIAQKLLSFIECICQSDDEEQNLYDKTFHWVQTNMI